MRTLNFLSLVLRAVGSWRLREMAVPWTFTLSQQVWQAQLFACWLCLLELFGDSWGVSWTALSKPSLTQSKSEHSEGVRAESADIWKRVGLKMVWGVQMPGLTPGSHSWAGTLPSIQWGELFGVLGREEVQLGKEVQKSAVRSGQGAEQGWDDVK